MKSKILLLLLLGLSVGLASAADIREGLVAYWPLDTTDGVMTPDATAFRNDLTLVNMDASNFVPGKRGKAASFDGTSQLLSKTYAMGEDIGLPVYNARRYTVMLWVNGVGATQGGTGTGDRRVFSEGSDTDNDPLFNIGTDSAGAATRTNVVDMFIRNTAAATQVNHLKSRGMAFDGTWHHIAWVEENGAGKLYIDGQLDAATFNYTRSSLDLNTISVGGIQRAAAGSFFEGLIDEVAVWERPLSQAEVQQAMANGLQTPVPAFGPTIVFAPQSNTNLIIGDSFGLTVQAAGARPLTYEWRKNNTVIPGADTATLTLSNMTAPDSGSYTVLVGNSIGSVTSAPATLLVAPPPPPNLPNGMVSYWPLDEVQGTKTPDMVSGYDMDLQNLTAADLVPGKSGNAFKFVNARQTMLERVHLAADELPIYKHPNFSISLWVNGPPGQQDLRVFSESSATANNPLFNLGTPNSLAVSTAALDIYIRTDAGTIANGAHQYSTAPVYDDTWHHVVYVQRDVNGAMQGALYIDGVKDPLTMIPVRPMTINVTTIGGIRRATRSFWFSGMIDDVAVWKRWLSQEEIVKLFREGTPKPGAIVQPLAIRSFRADRPALAKGDSTTLRWDVSKEATQVEIDQGVGDVTSRTTTGAGSVVIPVTDTKTYMITIRRGTEALSAQTAVAAVDAVASGWALLDNFDTYSPGPLRDTGWWGDLGANAVIANVNTNRMLDLRGTGRANILPLGGLAVKQGQQRTLFLRIYPQGDPAQAVLSLAGLTDRGVRTYGDAVDAGGLGPAAIPSNESGELMIGARNGVGAARDFTPPTLEIGQVYNLWLDVRNDPIDQGDNLSIFIQREGDPTRTQLFQNYVGDRDPAGAPPATGGGPTLPDLDKLFVGNNAVNAVFFDDFYISKSGYLSTVPRAFGFSGSSPASRLSISRVGNQIEIGWTGGTLESAGSVTGPWTAVTGATAPAFRTTPGSASAFYRVRQ
ncbi:MAG: immunoglobulin domain-containing protein [Verrucomicrobia bacterium]|nr:immunoglobulin domain-containing protein [Verrucomicrobiota bacterium]